MAYKLIVLHTLIVALLTLDMSSGDSNGPPGETPVKLRWKCTVSNNQPLCQETDCSLHDSWGEKTLGIQPHIPIFVSVENKECCYPTEAICNLYCQKVIQDVSTFVYCSDGHCANGCTSATGDCPLGKRLYGFNELDDCNKYCNDLDFDGCFSQP